VLISLLLSIALATDAEVPDKPAFFAGSYGRVQMSTDLAGGGGDRVSLAHHGPRLGLSPYMELDLGWKATLPSEATFSVLITPALSGELFHYDGQFGDDLALRNFYAEARNFVPVPLTFWAGARMYRGDDIYLLDFWPLDQLNTFGGGLGWTPDKTEIAAHVGVNRLQGDDYQLQEVLIATPNSVSGETVLYLDRQRTIGSLRASRQVPVGDMTLRFKAYGEIHKIPAGVRVRDDAFAELLTEDLPADGGATIGMQISAWGWSPQSFVHVWARHSSGLATYGELSIPTEGLALDMSARSAESWMFAVAGNHETKWLGVMAGAYAGSWSDADGQKLDFDDRWELVGVVRPQVYVTEHVSVAVEASNEWIRPNGVNPRTDSFDIANITQLSLLPGVQVARGGYSRPRLQAVYTLTALNQGAVDFHAADDSRVRGKTQHFIGLGAEWWVNSQRTITPG
jgi:maltoporin